MDESEKMLKIDFPPRRTDRKQQKLHFRHGWNWKNAENHISNPLEAEKQPQNDFLALRETQKQPQNDFLALREM